MLTEETLKRIDALLLEAWELTGWDEIAGEPQCLQDANKHISAALDCLRSASVERKQQELTRKLRELSETRTRVVMKEAVIAAYDGLLVPNQGTLDHDLSFHRTELDRLRDRVTHLDAEIAALEAAARAELAREQHPADAD